MNKTFTSISALALGLVASTLAHAAPPADSDQVAAAFARMLSHTPSHAAPAAAIARSADPLLDQLVAGLARHRTGTTAETATPQARLRSSFGMPEEQLAASFQRMLDHEAGNSEPQYVAEATPDPLLQQLSAALWPERLAAAPKERQP